MSGTVDFAGYRFIPGPFQYSAGVAALPGFMVQRVRFLRPVRLAEGFARIEAFLSAAGLSTTAFCACELRSPAPFTDDGFIAFNREYVGTLARWGVVVDAVNPVARSNVCPAIDPPDAPSFHAFSHVMPADGAAPSFVVAGSGESREGPGLYKDNTVRYGDVSPAGMVDKVRYVMGQMEKRMALLGTGWHATTAAQAYTVQDVYPSLAPDIVAKGAAPHGIDWHWCRPPVIGLEFEMDCRAVYREVVLPT